MVFCVYTNQNFGQKLPGVDNSPRHRLVEPSFVPLRRKMNFEQ